MAKFVNIKTQLNTVPINNLKKVISTIYQGSSIVFTCKVGGDFRKLAQVLFCFNQGDNEKENDNAYEYSAFTILESGTIKWNEYSEDGVYFTGTYDEQGNITAINLVGSAAFTEKFYENDFDDLMDYKIIAIYNPRVVPNAPARIMKQPSILVIRDETKKQVAICSEDLLCSEDLYCSDN